MLEGDCTGSEVEASMGLLVCVGTGSEGRAPGMGITSSLVLFRVAPEAEPVIRQHHQCEDRWRGRNEGKGRGDWSTWGWISSYLEIGRATRLNSSHTLASRMPSSA